MKSLLRSQFFGMFYLLRRERSGLLTLAALVAGVIVVYRTIPEEAYVRIDPELRAHYVNVIAAERSETPEDLTREAYFKFDPNTVSREALCQLGLSPSRADAIIRYREKRGGFACFSDFASMYVLPQDWLDRHRDDITLPAECLREHPAGQAERTYPTEQPKDTPGERALKSIRLEPSAIDINTVDSTGLVAVRGIGPASAIKIIGYRERLGGFIDPSQFDEIRGLHPAVAERLREVANVEPAPRKIDLNSIQLDELAGHPYLNYKLARSLVAMRSHRGGRLTVDDLSTHHLITDSLLNKLLPYLHE